MQAAPIDKISFKDLDIGYESFARALRGIRFQVYFVTPGGSPQRFFTLPATSKSPDGEDLSEYAVVTGIWSGVSESVAILKEQRPGKLIKARSVQLNGHNLTFEGSEAAPVCLSSRAAWFASNMAEHQSAT